MIWDDGVFVAVDAGNNVSPFSMRGGSLRRFRFSRRGEAPPRVEVPECAGSSPSVRGFDLSGRSACRHGSRSASPGTGRSPHQTNSSMSIAAGALAHGFPFL